MDRSPTRNGRHRPLRRQCGFSRFRYVLAKPENPSYVRALAVICLGTAASSLLKALTMVEFGTRSLETRMVGIVSTTLTGILCWFGARYFRVWMLHLMIIIGLNWGCFALAMSRSQFSAAITLVTLIWTCLLIGYAYPRTVVRGYAVVLTAGIYAALLKGPFAHRETFALALVFGVTILITMEVVSRISSLLRNDATRDPLTGLLNRKGLAEAILQAERLAERRNSVLAVAHLDLDGLKAINDRHGHARGDQLLIESADLWSAELGLQDVLARTGGDEFVVLLPGLDRQEATVTLTRLHRISPARFTYGLAIVEPGEKVSTKLADADAMLIAAKAAKRRAAARKAETTKPIRHTAETYRDGTST